MPTALNRLLIITGLLLLALPAQAQPTETPAPIVIGVVAPMTGVNAPFGQHTVQGMQLAIDAVNAKGGGGGRKVELRTRDSMGNPRDAAAAAVRLLEDHPALIVGDVASGATLAIAAVTTPAGVPLLAPAATHRKPMVLVKMVKRKPTFLAELRAAP